MTECERLVLEKRIREQFLVPEKRCDFNVDKKRKEMWAIELDLYMKFAEVCERYGLRYFLIFGSLLGCIRHEGFIPWDDDLDVAMPRDDYEKFLKLDKEFSCPYFLQTPMTDKYSGFSVAKLRNSNTTAIAAPFRYQEMNHGIFIDIVPIDRVKMEDAEENYFKIRELALQNSTYMRLSNPKPSVADAERIQRWQGRNPLDVYNEIQSISMQHKTEDVKFAGIIAATIYNYKKQIFNSCDFEEVLWKKFEDIEVPIPKGYDNILTILYGNYMEYPPIEERGYVHDSLLFDPNVGYKQKLKELLA